MNEFIRPDWPAHLRVHSLQTTRKGGISQAPYDSLNLGEHVGDDALAVAENRRLLGACLPAAPMWLEQVHGAQVVDLNGSEQPCRVADGAITRKVGTVCSVMTADCLPVLFCDQGGTVVGAAHAGWRGLLAGVLENTVAAMAVPETRVLAWLGPAIGPDAFEVGEEVLAGFLQHDPEVGSCFRKGLSGKYFADMYALARCRLRACGVHRIYGETACTYSDKDRFFSYRRDGTTGRMASLVWLEDV